MKKKLLFALGAIAVYAGLLMLLTLAEGGAEDASITGFFPALWYSLVTVTTVGYGDLYPVTVAGRLIGVVFLLLSAGALTALIGFAASWFSGSGLPWLRLRLLSAQRYYIFDRDDSVSRSLAGSISAEDGGALCLFASAEEPFSSKKRLIGLKMESSRILELLSRRVAPLTLILTGDQSEARLPRESLPAGTRVYCYTDCYTERSSPEVSYFNRSGLCSSLYWQKNPLRPEEKKIVLVGFGTLGRRLLEEALTNGIFSPVCVREYTVFGDGEPFLADHPALSASVSIGRPSESCDSLMFTGAPWNGASALSEADRILLCADEEQENADIYGRLVTFFPLSAPVTIFSSRELPGLPVFGSDREIFTAETVLNTAVEQTARAMHELYRVCTGGPEWETLSDFTRRSNLASAAHMGMKVRWLLGESSLTVFSPDQLREAYRRFIRLRETDPDLCRRIEHERWARFHTMYNWRYGEMRCPEKRLHPMLVPYEDLDEENRAKDDAAWETILSLAEYTEKHPGFSC